MKIAGSIKLSYWNFYMHDSTCTVGKYHAAPCTCAPLLHCINTSSVHACVVPTDFLHTDTVIKTKTNRKSSNTQHIFNISVIITFYSHFIITISIESTFSWQVDVEHRAINIFHNDLSANSPT